MFHFHPLAHMIDAASKSLLPACHPAASSSILRRGRDTLRPEFASKQLPSTVILHLLFCGDSCSNFCIACIVRLQDQLHHDRQPVDIEPRQLLDLEVSYASVHKG